MPSPSLFLVAINTSLASTFIPIIPVPSQTLVNIVSKATTDKIPKSFPWYTLEKAIQAATQIERTFNTQTIQREDAASAMGFKSHSGSARKAIADLASYGLLEARGTGMVGITNRAMRILHNVSYQEKWEAVSEAISKPRLFSTLNDYFADSTSVDKALVVTHLIRRGLSASAANRAATSFISNRAYASQGAVYLSDGLVDNEPHEVDKSNVVSETFTGLVEDQSIGFTNWVTVRVGAETSVSILVNGEMGPDQIKGLIAILEVQRSVLEASNAVTKESETMGEESDGTTKSE